MKKVLIYKKFERFWHWMQAALILFLALTGFEIHGSYSLLGFETAVKYHNIAAYAFIILIAFAIFWHFTTGLWRQYVPTLTNLKSQFNYYLFGIFKNVPHPTKKTVLSKLNPLQKLTYFGLKVLVIPIMVTSGLLYLTYRTSGIDGVQTSNIAGINVIAFVHTAGAFLLVAFIILHLYLITTGKTILTNLEAMITGYEEIDIQDENESTKNENEIDTQKIMEIK